LFRSPSLDHALNIYKSLLGLAENSTAVSVVFGKDIILLLFALSLAFFLPDTLTLRERFINSVQAYRKNTIYLSAGVSGILAVLGVLCFSRVQHFLYSGF
jgi:hypothetical protein